MHLNDSSVKGLIPFLKATFWKSWGRAAVRRARILWLGQSLFKNNLSKVILHTLSSSINMIFISANRNRLRLECFGMLLNKMQSSVLTLGLAKRCKAWLIKKPFNGDNPIADLLALSHLMQGRSY